MLMMLSITGITAWNRRRGAAVLMWCCLHVFLCGLLTTAADAHDVGSCVSDGHR